MPTLASPFLLQRAIACAGLAALAFSAALPANATGKSKAPSPPLACAALAVTLDGLPAVKTATSKIVPAVVGPAPVPSHCQVDVLVGENANQNINIRVGLPLNSLNGGTGGVQGAWNGRTQGIGGGGCAGSVNVGPPVAAGYVGSGNDTGHVGGDCEPGVNLDGTYNLQFINDFIRNGIQLQVLFMKSVANTYYGMRPKYNYWNGCSTGGRQGYLLAQELPKELDGILANAPAIYWTRFQTAQMWGQIAMKELVGGPIDPPPSPNPTPPPPAIFLSPKLGQATVSAVAACDANDGVVDGIIDDPRTCNFSAKANVCGAPTAPATNCLTPAEADAIDQIWDGPRNAKGQKIWFGLDKGTQLGGAFSLNGFVPFFLGVTQFHWNKHDRTFDWQTVNRAGYAQVAQDGSRNIADVTDTFGDLDAFRRHGGKLLTMVGANDQLIMPRGVINYYREMAARYDRGLADDIGLHNIDFQNIQKFYRMFRAPGVAHCAGGAGPQPQGLFDALVNWVENGVAPDSILAKGGAVPTRTRPLCPYPQTAIYKGSGSTDDAANFHCGGNLENREVVCADLITRYKHEVNGPPDFIGSGVNPLTCKLGGHKH